MAAILKMHPQVAPHDWILRNLLKSTRPCCPINKLSLGSILAGDYFGWLLVRTKPSRSVDFNQEHATAEEVTNAILLCERLCNVPRWCTSVGVDTLVPDDRVEGLKCLGGKENCGAKVADVFHKMNKNMEFWFVKPARVPFGDFEKKMIDASLEVILINARIGLRKL